MSTSARLLAAACLLSAACAGDPLASTPCEAIDADPACGQACDGAGDQICPTGLYCGGEGTCTADCSPGDACPNNTTCGNDGRCGGGDDLGGEPECPAVTLTTSRVTPSIQLLIDQSGSMGQDFGAYDRYNAVRIALTSANAATPGVVTAYQGSAYFGASLYTDGGTCPRLRSVAAGRALNNRDAIAQLISSNDPDGETPTGEAIEAAVADFAANPPPAGSPPIILLATDGEPDVCSNGSDENAGRQRSVAEAQAAFAAGIKVVVLSVGDDVAEEHLQRVANAGAGLDPATGDAPYFVANDPAELAAQLGTIVGDAVSCELDLDGAVSLETAGSGTVTLDGAVLTFGTDWEMVDNDTLRLIGTACATLQGSSSATVNASFPCGAVID